MHDLVNARTIQLYLLIIRVAHLYKGVDVMTALLGLER